MNRILPTACLLLVLTFSIASFSTIASSSSSVNWAGMRGVAYRSGANAYYCVIGSSSCDSPTVAPPDVAFAVYKASGFNFARISLDWYYAEVDPSGFQSLLTSDANACDANGISCYYMWGGSYQYIPPDLENAWGCAGDDICFHNNFGADAAIPSGTGTPWDSQPVWQALWNGLFKPAIQVLDSHTSTVGYAPFNEPNTGWTNSQLISFYAYMAQQIRTLSSKAVIFQASGGGSGGGGSATIGQLAPVGYAPYVFEIHNYQGVLNYNPYPQAASDCAAAGCAGVILGEWGGTSSVTNPPSGYSTENEYMTDEMNAVKQNGMGNEWFDYTGTNPTTGALTPTLTLLSQIDAQIFGGGGTSSTTTSTSSTTPTSTTTTSSTTSTTSTLSTSTTSTSSNSTTSSSTNTTTTSTTSSSTSSTSTSTSSSSSSSCTSGGVCLVWGYAPTSTSPGVSTQWQALVNVLPGNNPVGIQISWYQDGALSYSTTTGQGGGPTQGSSYYNTVLSFGTHTLYFAINGAQSSVLTVNVGGTTTTTTSTTTSTSSTSTTSTSTSSSTTTSLSSSTSTSTPTYSTSTTTTSSQPISTSTWTYTSSSQPSTSTSATTTSAGITTTSVNSTSAYSVIPPVRQVSTGPGPAKLPPTQVYGVSITSPGGLTYQGGSVIAAIDVSPNALSSPSVRLVVGPLPQGITVSLQPQSGAPPFTSMLQARVAASVPPGRYVIQVTSVSTAGNYSVSYSLNVVQQQGIPPHDVTVAVHDVYGIPVSGASVTFEMGGWSDTLQTSGSGTVVFGNIPPGPYNVTVSYMGASSVLYGDASVSQLGVTIVLSPPVALTIGGFVVVSALVVLVRRLRKPPVI